MRLGLPCRVRRPAPRGGQAQDALPGKVAWFDEEMDMAVIELDEAVFVGGPPLVCVEVDHPRPLDFYFTGFPEASERDMRTASGTLSYVPTSGRFDLDYHNANPQREEQWGGVSGAMVFHEDHAVGVVRAVSRFWNKKFTATPLALMLRDPDFGRYWAGECQPNIRIVRLDKRSAGGGGGNLPEMSRLLTWCDRTPEFRKLSRLTKPVVASKKSKHGFRLLGLAGHCDHNAFLVLPRLVEELQARDSKVRHIRLLRHPDFNSVNELDEEVADSLHEQDVGSADDTPGALAASALYERWHACVISTTIDCAALGRAGTLRRLRIADEWMDTLEDFPCPVVFTFIMRWGRQAKPGWLSHLLGRSPDPEAEARTAWSELEREHGIESEPDKTSFCRLDFYIPEDVRRWVRKKNVEPELREYVGEIESAVDGWFAEQPSMTFVELHGKLSKLTTQWRPK